jgi:hypothetical protein
VLLPGQSHRQTSRTTLLWQHQTLKVTPARNRVDEGGGAPIDMCSVSGEEEGLELQEVVESRERNGFGAMVNASIDLIQVAEFVQYPVS